MTTGPGGGQAEFWVYYYGAPHVFTVDGWFDPAAITRGDPIIVVAAVPAGEGQGLADHGGRLWVNPTVVAIDETDLVVAASPAVAQDEVEAFVAFISGAAD
jgi:hypothetical protein